MSVFVQTFLPQIRLAFNGGQVSQFLGTVKSIAPELCHGLHDGSSAAEVEASFRASLEGDHVTAARLAAVLHQIKTPEDFTVPAVFRSDFDPFAAFLMEASRGACVEDDGAFSCVYPLNRERLSALAEMTGNGIDFRAGFAPATAIFPSIFAAVAAQIRAAGHKKAIHLREQIRILRPIPIDIEAFSVVSVEKIRGGKAGKPPVLTLKWDFFDRGTWENFAVGETTLLLGLDLPGERLKKPVDLAKLGTEFTNLRITIPKILLGQYAEVSGDRNPIHDPDTEDPILHGMATLNLAERMFADRAPKAQRDIEVTFVLPVRPGDTLRFFRKDSLGSVINQDDELVLTLKG